MTRQISLTLPESLWFLSRDYTAAYGYRSLQEFIVDLVRKKLLPENLDRYKAIEERMKKGVRVKKFNQKEAMQYLKGL